MARRDFTLISIGFMLSLLFVPVCVKEVWAAQATQLSPPATDAATIDQCNPNGTYLQGYVLYYYNFFNILGCGQTRIIQTWLKFDISGIPPGATIVGASLSASLSYARVPASVGVYFVSSNAWSQASITWNNAPLSSVSATPLSSTYVANTTANYFWDVSSGVAAAVPAGGRLTLVLHPTTSEGTNVNGWIVFVASSMHLSVTYSYASVAVSLSTNPIQYGNSVLITGNTNPSQSQGTFQLQYSLDQFSWFVIGTQNGGSYTGDWTPPSVGTYYIRGVWQTTWNNGANNYMAVSSVSTLVVTPATSTVLLTLSQTTVILGSSVTITAAIVPAGVSDGIVTIQDSTDGLNWNTLSEGAPQSGTSSYSWSPNVVGTYYVRASWTGDQGYSGSTSTQQTLVVQYGQSSIQLSLSQSTIYSGSSVTLTANITPNTASDGTVTIQESTDGLTWSTLGSGTPGFGTFSYNWTPSAAGTYYLRASWTGDQDYLGSTSTQQTLVVQHIPTSISINAPATSQLKQPITIVATLRDNANNPISGALITFQFDSSSVATATTGLDGSATLFYTPQVSAGSYLIGASYAGSSQYAPSADQTSVSVTPWKLIISTTIPNTSLVRFNGQDHTSDSTGQIVIRVNSTGMYSLSANSPVEISSGTRVVFVQWGDGMTSSSRVINVDSDVTLSVTTKTQYLLTIQSEYGNPSGSGWSDAGSSAQISVQSPVDQGNGTRRVLSAWTVGSKPYLTSANGTISMSEPILLQGVWQKQYLVSVETTGGSATGGGWYNAGVTATVSVSPTTYGFIIQQVFNGWQEGVQSQGGVSTFTVNGPVSLHALWRTDFTQLIILLVVAGAGFGGIGGYAWRRRKGRASTPGTPAGQAPKEAQIKEGAPRVEQKQVVETGTSVYAPTPCSSCGLVNPVGATYCAYCGATLNPQKN